MSATRKLSLAARWRQWRLARRFRRNLSRPLNPRLSITAAMAVAGFDDPFKDRPLDGAKGELRAQVRALVGAGAVDEDHGDTLDRLIDAWTRTQLTTTEHLYMRRMNIGEQLIAEARERVIAAEGHLRFMEARHTIAERAITEAKRGLLGPEGGNARA